MVTFRPMSEDDFVLVAEWLGRDHVQAWWRDPTAPARVADKYGPRISGDEPTEMFVVIVDDVAVGMIQRYRIADHPETLACLAAVGFDASRSGGIDYLVGDAALTGRGVGTEMIGSFTDLLFEEDEAVTSIAVTPQAANVASCRVLEKSGYRRIWTGVLDSDDPSDEGEAALYVKHRPG